MNDEFLEQELRKLPAPELPAAWRAEILASASEARTANSARRYRPGILPWLRALVARNPMTTGALATLWFLVFAFHAATPVDPSARAMLARIEPGKPVYLVDLATEIRLTEILENQPDQTPAARIP